MTKRTTPNDRRTPEVCARDDFFASAEGRAALDLEGPLADVFAGTKKWHIEQADVFDFLEALPAGKVNCVVTSPPY